MIWLVLALFGLLAWLFLLSFHGGFWRADQRLLPAPDPDQWPDVVAVIPARDEAETIYQVIASHARSDFPGNFSVVVVDDGSSDGTADIAREAAGLGSRPVNVVEAPELEPGWTGKLWAVHHGLRAAREASPNAAYVLLTDADIAHAPDTLRRLVARSERDGLALNSLMAKLDARGFWGGLLMPAFVFFFQQLYPFRWSNDPNRYLAAAAGGCMLVKREALREVGGVAPIKGELIDDCALARLLKGEPPVRAIRISLATAEVLSLRDNRRLSSVWDMVARTAFTQLGQSWAAVAGTVLGMFVVYLAGPLAVLLYPVHGSGSAALIGALAWGASAYAYRPTSALYGEAPWKALGLPIAAAYYTAMTVSSAWRWTRNRGGGWKGRTQSKPEAAEEASAPSA